MPGGRLREPYSVLGGADSGTSDGTPKKIVGARVLENVYPNKVLGAYLKRRGSVTESIATGLGVPLGISEHLAGSAESLIPVTRTLLVNFAGTFYKLVGSTWSSVNVDTNTDFSVSKQNTSCRFSEKVFIAGGRPAKWAGGTEYVERVGIPAPAAAPTIAASVAPGALTGTYRYIISYYNEDTGLESDWSDEATITVTAKDVSFTGLPTTASARGVTHKRIYRTQNGGELFYLVDAVALATTTYTDDTLDEDLGIYNGELGDRALPPDNSYICAAFANRIWWVDKDDQHKLVYSSPYIGSDNDLEYYPTDNFLISDEPITSLLVTPHKMLVFHPRNISAISGFSDSDFVFSPYRAGIGTVFSNGVASNGDQVICLAEEGFVDVESYNPDGPDNHHISRPIDYQLQSIIDYSYNNSLYCSIVWSPSIRQFLFLLSAISTTGIPWVVSGTGEFAGWEDSSTLTPAYWEDQDIAGGGTTARFFLWGWSPETAQWVTYKYAQISDLNDDDSYGTFLYHPLPSSNTLDPQQDKTYMGVYNGTDTDGYVISCHRRDTSLDDSSPVTAKVLTDRIPVGENGNYGRLRAVSFNSPYSDPTTNGTLQYLADFEEPEKRDWPSNLKDFTSNGDMQVPEEGRMRFMHLYVENQTGTADTPVLQDFVVHRIDRSVRQGR